MTHFAPLGSGPGSSPSWRPTEATVRLQVLEEEWETCGVERLRGVMPANIELSANRWGSDTCSFTLHRDSSYPYADLSVFTPCIIEVGGIPVWSGRIWQTPIRSGDGGSIQVEGQGWQYHLDDDVLARSWVHTKQRAWADSRSSLYENTAEATTPGQVWQGAGGLKLSWLMGTSFPAGERSSALLDLGVSDARRVVVTYTSSASANVQLDIHAGVSAEVANESATLDATPIAASGSASTTFTEPHRFLRLDFQSTSTHTPGADEWIIFSSIQVFRDATYESGNVSVLTADTVIKDARNSATRGLNAANGNITAGTFSIPEMHTGGNWRTPREIIEAANAYHGWTTKVLVDRSLKFAAKPTAPIFDVGTWGAVFESAGGAGEDIYSDVLIEGQDAGGRSVHVRRAQAARSGAIIRSLTSPSHPNPTFASNTGSWLASASLTRDTAVYDSSPASGQATSTGGRVWLHSDWTAGATFSQGITYRLDLAVRTSAAAEVRIRFGVESSGVMATDHAEIRAPIPATTWTDFSLSWTPTADRSSDGVRIWIEAYDAVPTNLWVDSLALFRSYTSFPTRRSSVRTKILPVSSALTYASAAQIGDTFLADHDTAPFKGSLNVQARGDVRSTVGGAWVHPSELLLHTDELVRLTDRVDPDTGGWGAQGRIAEVAYRHDTQSARISVDSQRHRLESLLERLAVVTGQQV